MKKLLLALAIGLQTSTFAYELLQPLAKGPSLGQGNQQFEFELKHFNLNRYFDDNGKSDNIPSDQSFMKTDLQVHYKVGINNALDFEFKLPFSRFSAESPWGDNNETGIEQPEMSLKAAPQNIPLGAFLSIRLPFGTKQFVGNDPYTMLEYGTLLNIIKEQFKFQARVSYLNPIDQDGEDAEGIFRIAIRPQFKLPNAKASIFLNLSHARSYDGDGTHTALMPGVSIPVTEKVILEPNFSLTVSGKNTSGFWALALNAKSNF